MLKSILSVLFAMLLVMGLTGQVQGPGPDDRRSSREHGHVAPRAHDAYAGRTRIHAVPSQSAKTVSYRHNHNYWHPRYNSYQHQYHFYPYVYTTPVVYLSNAYVPISLGNETYYYDGGAFYQQEEQGYTAVLPPMGIIVQTLPEGTIEAVFNNETYYIYNEVYYKPVPGGYQVVAPPHPG